MQGLMTESVNDEELISEGEIYTICDWRIFYKLNFYTKYSKLYYMVYNGWVIHT